MNTVPDSGSLESLQPQGWPRAKGYAHAVKVPAGCDLVFTAGQIGWDADEVFVSDDFVEQFAQALRNCLTLVQAAGGGAEHIVRLTMYCRDKRQYLDRLAAVGQAYRAVLGRHYPAMSLLEVAGLIDEQALIEIEATAAVPCAKGGND